MENATFPCKTALLKTTDETNRIGSTKWTYKKQLGFASNYFIFYILNLISS